LNVAAASTPRGTNPPKMNNDDTEFQVSCQNVEALELVYEHLPLSKDPLLVPLFSFIDKFYCNFKHRLRCSLQGRSLTELCEVWREYG
jgi:hypothetical protein